MEHWIVLCGDEIVMRYYGYRKRLEKHLADVCEISHGVLTQEYLTIMTHEEYQAEKREGNSK